MKKLMFLAFFCLLSCLLQADKPIFMLLTHARATATAFEKVMRAQEGLVVLHAPFIVPYLVQKYGPDHSFTTPLVNPPKTLDEVKENIFHLAKTSPVFFKEQAYLLIDYLKANPTLYNNTQVKVAFLVRDPAKSILSFHRKMPTVHEAIVGHRQLWEAFLLIKERLGITPLVIDSDEFLKNPLFILNQLGKEWGLQFDEKNLSWESGYADDWHLSEWYDAVAVSTKLGSYRGDVQRELDGTPKYLEVPDQDERARLQNLYRSQVDYYNKLFEFAIKVPAQ